MANTTEGNIQLETVEMAGEPETMSPREISIIKFLEKSGLGSAQRISLAGDASFRRYERIKTGSKSFILMDAPPPKEDVRPFIKVARYLAGSAFSAPAIYAEDTENGLLLLEDLGDDLYSAILSGDYSKELEEKIYKNAVDLLSALHNAPTLPDFPAYSDEVLLREAALFTDWYLPYAAIEISENSKREYNEILLGLFTHLKKQKPVAVLRDYHAENLIYLKGRRGNKKVGLLDFQDALIGSPAYDLASLLKDARRDLSPNLEQKIYDYYLSLKPETDKETFSLCYAILGTQRNLKIMGIFARLAVRDEKRRYLWFLPRVWKHLGTDLAKPELADLRKWMEKTLPAGKNAA